MADDITVAEMGAMLSRIEALEKSSSASVEAQIDFSWLFVLMSAFNIILMQAGFAFLEVGSVQSKNSKSILFKNMLDMGVTAIVWLGFGFHMAKDGASGQQEPTFFGISSTDTVAFVHSYAFAGTAATIVSGAVAERMNPTAYIFITVSMVGLVYPMAVRWVWSSEGFLNNMGFLDFAGSGVIHMMAGCAGLIGASLLGPRTGRFPKHTSSQPTNSTITAAADNNEEQQKAITMKAKSAKKWWPRKHTTSPVMKSHSTILSTLGTLLLFFGWLNFNASSILFQDHSGNHGSFKLAGRAASNTILASAGSMMTYFFLQKLRLLCILRSHEWFWLHRWRGVPTWFVAVFISSFQGPQLSLEDLNNALLTGAVAITAGCAYVDSTGALWIGAIATGLGMMASKIISMLGVDDPLNVTAIHGVAGCWGVLATGLFAVPGLAPGTHYGLLYGGGWALLSVQVQGALILLCWSLGTSLCIMCPMFCSFQTGSLTLRLDQDEEVAGMDFVWHDTPRGKELDRDLVRYYHEVQAAERRLEAKWKKRRVRCYGNSNKNTAEKPPHNSMDQTRNSRSSPFSPSAEVDEKHETIENDGLRVLSATNVLGSSTGSCDREKKDGASSNGGHGSNIGCHNGDTSNKAVPSFLRTTAQIEDQNPSPDMRHVDPVFGDGHATKWLQFEQQKMGEATRDRILLKPLKTTEPFIEQQHILQKRSSNKKIIMKIFPFSSRSEYGCSSKGGMENARRLTYCSYDSVASPKSGGNASVTSPKSGSNASMMFEQQPTKNDDQYNIL